jgi:hypothetical protein
VCSEITFDQKSQDELSTISNLRGFLEKEKLGSGTYFDYLYVPTNPNLIDVFKSVNFPSYSTKDKLVVFYSAFKTNALDKFIYSNILPDFVNSWRAGREISGIDDIAFVHIQPIGSLPQCTKWINQAPKI